MDKKEIIRQMRSITRDLFVYSRTLDDDHITMREFIEEKSDYLHELAELLENEGE